jgi:hypothetical protein
LNKREFPVSEVAWATRHQSAKIELRHQSASEKGNFMSEIPTVGVALAKEAIVVCAEDAQGRTVYFKQLSFGGFGRRAATLPACTFGMEACSTAHHWGRFQSAQGHKPKLMAAEFVAPFRKRYALTPLPLASDSGAPGAVFASIDLKGAEIPSAPRVRDSCLV